MSKTSDEDTGNCEQSIINDEEDTGNSEIGELGDDVDTGISVLSGINGGGRKKETFSSKQSKTLHSSSPSAVK